MDDDSLTQHFYIATGSSPADDRTRVLKYGKTFAVFDRYGDIETVGLKEQGIFCEGTRFLSQMEFYLDRARPLMLSSTVKADNSLFTADLANVDISRHGEIVIPRGTLHVLRTKFLWHDVCYEQFQMVNYGTVPVDIPPRFSRLTPRTSKMSAKYVELNGRSEDSGSKTFLSRMPSLWDIEAWTAWCAAPASSARRGHARYPQASFSSTLISNLELKSP